MACSERRMSCEVTPSARARSWSISSLRLGTGSSQSSCTLPTSGVARITSPTSSARRRTSAAVGAGDAHLHRPADRRTVEQAVGLGAHVGEVVRQHLAHPQQRALARLDRLRHQHQLGEVLVLELLVERQVEARRAFADEGGDVGEVGAEVGICSSRCSTALASRSRLGERGALGQPQVDQDLGPVGGREELLRDEGEAGDAGDQRADGQPDHGAAPAHAPGNDARGWRGRGGVLKASPWWAPVPRALSRR